MLASSFTCSRIRRCLGIGALCAALLIDLPARAQDTAPPAEAARPDPQAATKLELAGRLRLALSNFESAPSTDPRDTWIPTAAQESLSWRLRRLPSVVVIPNIRVFQASRELQETPADKPDWARVVQLLGAQVNLSALADGNPDALTLRLTLTRLDGAAPQTQAVGPARLPETLNLATDWLIEQLGAHDISVELKEALHAPPAASPSALEYYARAVMAARAENIRDAVYYAGESVGYDPKFRSALMLLAQVEMRSSRSGLVAAPGRLRILAELARRAEDCSDRAEAELAHGVLMQLTGSTEAAIQRFETALSSAGQCRDPYGQVASANALADAWLGRVPAAPITNEQQRAAYHKESYTQAARWQERVLDMLAELNDQVAEPSAANKLALVYERLEEKERALAMHERTLAASKRIGSRRGEATAWMFLGQWRRQQQQWPEAVEATQRCLELADEQSRPSVHIALGTIYRGKGDFPAALQCYETAYAALSQSNDLASQLLCLREMASLYMETGKRDQAIARLQEALDIAHAMQLPAEATLREQIERWKRGEK